MANTQPTTETSLLQCPPLVAEPALIKIMVIKEKHVDQILLFAQKDTPRPVNVEVIGRTRAFVLFYHGPNKLGPRALGRMHRMDFIAVLMQKSADYKTASAAAEAEIESYPQLFEV